MPFFTYVHCDGIHYLRTDAIWVLKAFSDVIQFSELNFGTKTVIAILEAHWVALRKNIQSGVEGILTHSLTYALRVATFSPTLGP